MLNSIDKISEQMVERYSTRYSKMGYDVKTLGWGSLDQQQYRFSQALKDINLDNKTLLDIGCGFGDLLAMCIANNNKLNKYIGWDINNDLITEATKIWKESKIETSFEVSNISKTRLTSPIADIGIMLGVLNLNLNGEIDNYEYSKLLIKNAFTTVSELLIIDFLSSKISNEYDPENFIFYHDPAIMLDFAFELSPNVLLKHNYSPIPQKEFTLYIYK